MTVRIHPKYIDTSDHVWLWDIGPVRVEPPKPPVEPVEAKDLKGADFALARIHYEDALEDYKLSLRAYGEAKKHYSKWHTDNGGPRKVRHWSTDAVHSLTVDPERYFLELPRGMKAGKAQAEDDRIAAMSEAELTEAREKDPQFGKGMER